MTLRDVLEYRAADTEQIVFSPDDIPAAAWGSTIYARPFGAQQWGYYSGPMYWDAEYRTSHKGRSEGGNDA